MKKATFTNRLLAYLIDSIIVLLVSSIIAIPLTSKKIESLEHELKTITKEYTEQNIDMNTYLEKTQDLNYQIQKESLSTNVVYLIVSIIYYVVFQYLNKGQTLGKKLLKIKVVNKEGNTPSLYQMILRTFITNQIFTYLVTILLVLLATKEQFLSMCNALVKYQALSHFPTSFHTLFPSVIIFQESAYLCLFLLQCTLYTPAFQPDYPSAEYNSHLLY